MYIYRIIVLSAGLALLAPIGSVSADGERAAQQAFSGEQIHSLAMQDQSSGYPRESEGRQDAEKRQDAERRKDAEQRRGMEERQDAERREDGERRRDMEKRQDAERRQDGERRRDMEQRQDSERRRDAARGTMTAEGIRAEGLIGQPVISRQNQKEIGKVSGFVMDENGQIESAVVERGGFLGFFTNEVTVPRGQWEISEDGKTMATHMDRKELREMARHDRD